MLSIRSKNLLAMFAIMLCMFLVACGGGEETSEAEDDTKAKASDEGGSEAAEQVLNLSGTADFTSLDVHHASDAPSFDALYQIQSGLIGFDKDESFIPDLAADEPKVNDDQTEYTFTIRDDAEWSNGEPVTANDFVYAWKRAVNPNTASEYAFIFGSAEILNAAEIMDPDSDLYGNVDELGVEAVDEKTLKATLEKPIPYFVTLMSFPAFYPFK